MLSRENQVVVAFGLLAIGLMYAVATFTDLPTWVGVAVVIVVGVVLPQLLLGAGNG